MVVFECIKYIVADGVAANCSVRGRVTVRKRFECGLELMAFTAITFNAQRLASLRVGMRENFFWQTFFQNNITESK